MDVTFGTGKISGSLARDTFQLGSKLLVVNQTFGMINSEKGEVFKSGSFDGRKRLLCLFCLVFVPLSFV